MTKSKPGTTERCFDIILDLDISPEVFDLSLKRSSAFSGYEVIVSFRRPHAPGIDNLVCRGDTPEEALRAAYLTLQHNFGKCEACGKYRSPDDHL